MTFSYRFTKTYTDKSIKKITGIPSHSELKKIVLIAHIQRKVILIYPKNFLRRILFLLKSHLKEILKNRIKHDASVSVTTTSADTTDTTINNNNINNENLMPIVCTYQ